MTSELFPTPVIAEQKVRDDADEVISVLDERFGSAKTPEDGDKRLVAVERIRERDPADIAANAVRAIRGVEDFFLEKQMPKSRLAIVSAMTKGVMLRRLRRKAAYFEQEFENTVFSNIDHGVPTDLGERANLKSAELMTSEWPEGKTGNSSGNFDKVVGNTRYVFANSDALPSYSNAAGNKEHYKISSTEGYAVPVDIAATYTIGTSRATGDPALDQLQPYADNIYTIDDFKKVFALYSATLFESPDQALTFYRMFKGMMLQGDRWKLDDFEGKPNWWVVGDWPSDSAREMFLREEEYGLYANDAARTVAGRMRELLETHGIYPPMEPEFQYPDHVPAERKDIDKS